MYVHGEISELCKVVSGVPQGSVLGPVLFLVMINDLPYNISCQSVLFADDTSLYQTGSDINELSVDILNSFNEANYWFHVNSLSLNVDKTQRILFTLGHLVNDDVESSIKLLGITLDSKLCWDAHISSICIRLARVIYLLRHLKRLVPVAYLKNAYYAFFNSILLYGILLWGNSGNVSKVLVLQKQAIRVLTGSSYDAHCKPLFVSQGILMVINLYIQSVSRGFTASNRAFS